MLKQWQQLVDENESHQNVIEWAYPLSEGVYLPTPLSSLEMALAVEADSLLKLFPGSKYSVFPEDAFSYFVNGEDAYALGWMQYMMFRFSNTIGWTSYTDSLVDEPHIDLRRIVRLMDKDPKKRIAQIKDSNPEGVAVAIQTNAEDELNEVLLPVLKKGGILINITVLPIEQDFILSLSSCFKDIKLIRPFWTTSAMLSIVILVGIDYTGAPMIPANKKQKLSTSYLESEKEVLESMLIQQRYIKSISKKDITKQSPVFLQFLTEGYSTWNI